MINELWKDIPESNGIYQVSNLGRVKSLKHNKEKILKGSPEGRGYLRVCLWMNKKLKQASIHRLVLQVFKPDEYFEGAVCNHRNGIKDCNTLENLEWCTQKQNCEHAVKTGLLKPSYGNTKLNQKIVNIIRYAYTSKYFNQKELANIFNVDTTTVGCIIRGKTWN